MNLILEASLENLEINKTRAKRLMMTVGKGIKERMIKIRGSKRKIQRKKMKREVRKNKNKKIKLRQVRQN
jgi:hypothetical protein